MFHRQPVSAEQIEHVILLVHGQRVMLDADLAALYGVETRELVQAVKRNLARFPGDSCSACRRRTSRL